MFEVKAEIHPKYCPSTTIYKWKSERTGLEVVLIKCLTPAVNGYFAVASEIDNDSGFPHTLEHLVFMGSKKWPYKGFLDVLGNKLLSSTNAWTGKDQTVYTLSTAGWEGFAAMLPIYLDHILNPIITKSTCSTEVYHIDGSGQERGVVFSEMQALENTPFSLLGSELHQKMYGKNHPYASNTGGLLSALRVITHEQIEKYHKDVYSPRNLSVIVTGQVEPEQVLAAMTKFDDSLENVAPMRRPFDGIDPAPLLEQTQIHKFEFPEGDETFGEVQMGWFGTSCSDSIGYEAMEILDYYFTSETTGILQKALVEVEDPLCSSLSLDTDDYKVTLVTLSLSCVPTDKLDQVDQAVMDILRKLCDPQNIDIEFMRQSIALKQDKFILSVENDPAAFAYMSIDNFLYGDDKDQEVYKFWSGEIDVFAKLTEWTANDWAKFIEKYFVHPHHVTLLGAPSQDLEKQIKAEKKSRAAEIKRDYDFDQLAKEIAQAKEENESVVPQEVLDSIPAPDLNNIHYITTETATANSTPATTKLQKHIDEDASTSDVKFNMQFESYQSKFVTIKIYLNSHLVDANLMPYIDVLLSEQFSFPMELDDGTCLSAEEVGLEVSKDLLANTLSTNAMLQEIVMIDCRLKRENYNKAIQWIERAIFNIIYEQDRILMHIKKFLASVSEEKREGMAVINASLHETTMATDSLRRQSEALIVEEFFKQEVKNLPKIEENLKRLSSQLFVAENFRILVFGNIYELPDPVSAWGPLYRRLTKGASPKPLVPVPFSNGYLSDFGRKPSSKSIITLCPTDSCYMVVIAPGPTDYLHKDTAALTLLNVYLGVTEGPLWRQVRGEGLAYGVRIYHRQEVGHIFCEFYRASDPVAAYKVTRDLLHDFANGQDQFEDEAIQGAVNSYVSALALDQSTASSAIIQKYFDSTLKNLGEGYVQRLVEQVSKVTKGELLAALKKYLLPLFEPETSAVFSACHESESESLRNYFQKLGFEVSVKNMLDGDESGSEDEFDSEQSEQSDSE